MERESVPQWMLWVTVSHGSHYGHRVTIQVVGKNSDPFEVAHWSWTGIGVPPDLMDQLESQVLAVLVEHLTTRYGIAF
jgi:hypothetical protein